MIEYFFERPKGHSVQVNMLKLTCENGCTWIIPKPQNHHDEVALVLTAICPDCGRHWHSMNEITVFAVLRQKRFLIF